MLLALTMWQAIRTRTDELVVVWDSGRADAVAREKMSQLVWGRLDSGLGAALVSLVEAVTLCDAMISQVRARLSFDPDTADQAARLRGLRAGLVRCEDLAGVDAGRRASSSPTLRDAGAEARHAGGPRRRHHRPARPSSRPRAALRGARPHRAGVAAPHAREGPGRRARRRWRALETREPTLHELADRCRREIAHPPKLAVPDVSRLGRRARRPAPSSTRSSTGSRRSAARSTPSPTRTARPLRERAELRYRLEGARAAADANGRSASPTVRSGYDEARAAVAQTPVRRHPDPLPRRAVRVPHPRPAHGGSGGTTMTAIACTEPGCTGTYEDGYCNVCGSPQAAPASAPAAPASATSLLGTGVAQAAPDRAAAATSPAPSGPPAPAAPARAGSRPPPSARPARRRRRLAARPAASARPRRGCAARGSAPA